jgi:polysaccharide export outer membrane protein
MNRGIFYLLLIISVLLCISTRDLIYLQDKDGTAGETTISQVTKPYRLQTNDVLSITIKASDSKLVEIFNTTNRW